MTIRPGKKSTLMGSRRLLLLGPLIFLGLFYFYPLIKIFVLSFFPTGRFDYHEISRFFTTTSYLKIVWFTCWQAALSTFLTLLVALPGAYIYAHYRFRGKKIIQILTTIPFVLPTVVVAAAFRALLGHGGILNSFAIHGLGFSHPPINLEQTVWFFLLAHVFYNYALVLRIVGSFWAGLAPELSHAASMLGASPWITFRKITLPLLMPAIGSAALLVFIFCFTSFGVILILGGPGFSTLEVEIYRQAVHLFNLPMAATLSLVQIVINFMLMWLHARLGEKNNLAWLGLNGINAARKVTKKWEKIAVSIHLLFVLSLLLAPMLALVLRSFLTDSGWSLAFYSALFSSATDSLFYVPPFRAILNSFGFGLATMTLALLLGLSAASYLALSTQRGKAFWDAVIMLPLATSAVTLGFGYIITLNKPPLNLRESLLLVVLAHTLVAFPFVVRCLLPAIRQIPHALREAATLLGASPRQVRKHVDFPLLRPALLVAAIFAFAISMGEFGASAFVTRPQTPTMPVAIFRFLSQPGEMNYGQAMAMSAILMVVTAAAFLFVEKLPDRSGGD